MDVFYFNSLLSLKYDISVIEVLDKNKDYHNDKFIMLIKPNYFYKRLIRKYLDRNLIYSKWIGYLSEKNEEIYDFFMDEVFSVIHTGGHSRKRDLIEFIRVINPKWLLPIHTNNKEYFKKYFDNIIDINNFEEIEV